MNVRRSMINKTVVITGGDGFLGHHLVPLVAQEYTDVEVVRKEYYDLLKTEDVVGMYHELKPDIVIHLAAVVGGIQFNQRNPAQLFHDNIKMGVDLIHEGMVARVEKFTCIGTICFPSGTKVICNPIIKSIEDVNVGDKVLSDDGTFNVVTDVFRSIYEGELITIDASGIPTLSATPEHPVKVMVRTGKSRKLKDWGKWREEWKKAKELKKGDFLVVPSLAYQEKLDDLLLEDDLCELFGIFIAEGSVYLRDTQKRGSRGHVYFSFGEEPEFIERTKELMLRYFHLAGTLVKIPRQKGYQLHYRNIDLAKYFATLFYNGKPYTSYNKKFPDDILRLPSSKIISALVGFFKGDGCFSHSSDRLKLNFSSSSEILIWQIKMMLGEIGIYSHIQQKKYAETSTILGRTVKLHRAWCVWVTGEKQVKYLKKLMFRENTALFGLVGYRTKMYRKGSDFIVPIFRLSRKMYTGEVHNLKVEGRQTYCANGIVVHNCSYPVSPSIPFVETDLWNGYPEKTNAPYGLAKRSLEVMCRAYRQQYGMNCIYLLPTNMWGIGDNFDPESGHVIPMLIKRFIEAKEQNLPIVTVWGTGTATREFLYVGDCAKMILEATKSYNDEHPMNLGSGKETSIAELAETIARLVDYKGQIVWDDSMPDGQPRRFLDISRSMMYLGFQPEQAVSLEEGLKKTIEWYLENRK
jgi:nucleoside-diphosphate-sugar epimerase